jgi:nitrate/TMAO reductase-like tetraheme cytochrome c subunit
MRSGWFLLLLAAVGVVESDGLPSAGEAPAVVSGRVCDAQGPVSGARVRFQGECPVVQTDAAGRFQLPAGKSRRVTAWKEGYAIAAAESHRQPLELHLLPLPQKDCEDYVWLDPRPTADPQTACGLCHEAIYREWAGSAHARAATNRRLWNLLRGEDWHGRPSPSWSLAAEHPLGAAVCASCHAPAWQDPTLTYDLSQVRGVAALGVHCDYCHKIVAAITEPAGRRFGRDGFRLLRPPAQELLFFGPLDDAYRPGEKLAYSPLYKQSRYCAPCHEGQLFGVLAYATYSEWQASPAGKAGRQCQDCHMTPTGALQNLAPGRGGIARDPRTLASHTFPGGTAQMLRRALHLEVQQARRQEGLQVVVQVRAEDVGHRVPTGFLDRHLVLVLQASDGQGQPLPPRQGPRLPPAAGQNLAGQAGWLYARWLDGLHAPGPVPFWTAHAAAHDTRLQPGQPDRRVFLFPAETRQIHLRLLYRRFWPAVAESKHWPDNEWLIHERRFSPPP